MPKHHVDTVVSWKEWNFLQGYTEYKFQRMNHFNVTGHYMPHPQERPVERQTIGRQQERELHNVAADMDLDN